MIPNDIDTDCPAAKLARYLIESSLLSVGSETQGCKDHICIYKQVLRCATTRFYR